MSLDVLPHLPSLDEAHCGTGNSVLLSDHPLHSAVPADGSNLLVGELGAGVVLALRVVGAMLHTILGILGGL